MGWFTFFAVLGYIAIGMVIFHLENKHQEEQHEKLEVTQDDLPVDVSDKP